MYHRLLEEYHLRYGTAEEESIICRCGGVEWYMELYLTTNDYGVTVNGSTYLKERIAFHYKCVIAVRLSISVNKREQKLLIGMEICQQFLLCTWKTL